MHLAVLQMSFMTCKMQITNDGVLAFLGPLLLKLLVDWIATPVPSPSPPYPAPPAPESPYWDGTELLSMPVRQGPGLPAFEHVCKLVWEFLQVCELCVSVNLRGIIGTHKHCPFCNCALRKIV